jgi:hypothetical protein
MVESEKPGNSLKRSANSIDKHVGNRVRMRRLMMKMSQERLGVRSV